ncbi:MAG: SDR family NAD(P)-dependent oxidoreductase, partial [Alphaproteobacteria bacterium]|nr:SDR family NAD(P)-dependent oxidoreductase [Alphaproteobacteria bacterium]
MIARTRRNEETPVSDALLDRGKYGPWAVIAGGSDGTGACFAYEAAKAGINLVLIARRPAPLATLADSLRHEFGVEVRTLSLDLNLSDAAARMQAATEDLEVGLYVHNA